jgi:TetR/AcrR family transcriptional regulator, cholesterol catabolism regulator
MPQSTAPPPSPESLTASQFARRERIVRVALKLLVHGDYEKIQMKDVAEGSDVALGTVYRYFTSKEHLFAAVQLEWVKSLHRQILKRPPAGDSNLERLSQVLHQSVRAFQTQPQFYRVLLVLEVTKDPFAKEL